ARLTTGAIERWHADYRRSRTAEKVLMVLRGILNYAVRQGWLADNPAKAVEHHPVRYSGDYGLYSREEVEALVRNAASEQDAAIYASAAMTGLRRGELVALRWRYVAAAKRAGLRSLPFHSLRHHFGSVAVNRASLVQVQAWMGYADIQTTARNLHHRSRASDAALLADAFAGQTVTAQAVEAGTD